MYVYLTMYNNGEQYEDNYEWVVGVFSSHELAEQDIFNRGYTVKNTKRMTYSQPEKTYGPCSHGFKSLIDCYKDDSVDCDFSDCPFVDSPDYSFMRIDEFVLDERKEW